MNIFTYFLIIPLFGELVWAEIYFKKGAPHVKLPNRGLLSGIVHFSRDGRPYHAFMGIPYATAERFQAPQPVQDTWEGVRSSVKPGNICPQQLRSNDGHESIGDEDCLNLNVYIPMNSTGKKGFPVMVWIHGGGFVFGNGVGYGAKYFMDEEVILVTLNYRLGVYGFISTGDQVIPGNNGLKDQVMALKWIQDNIKAFGGDPNKVTIFGESAGGVAVHYLTLSPTAKGLFHRAISQSGSALSLWGYQSQPKRNAVKLATHLECPTEGEDPVGITSEEILECLKRLSTEELTKAAFSYKTSWPPNVRSFFWVPTAEPVPEATSENTPFLTESPMALMQNKDRYQADVPYMIGMTEDEGCIMYSGIVLSDETLTKELDDNWSGIAPVAFDLINHIPPWKHNSISEQLRRFYFGDKSVSEATRHNLTNLYSDAQFVHGVYRTAVGVASRGKRNEVYLYQYAYPGSLSFAGMLFKVTINDTKRVGHGDELLYLFDFGPGGQTKPDSADETFSKNLVQLWASFAIHGDPKYTWGTASLKKWKPVSKKEVDGVIPLRWYKIDENPMFIDDPYKERNTFWDGILAEYLNPKKKGAAPKEKVGGVVDKTEL